MRTKPTFGAGAGAGAALVAIAVAIASSAADANATTTRQLTYIDNAENIVRCPARYECTVRLAPGEIVHKGDASDIPGWSPSVAYSGDATPNGNGASAAVASPTLRPYLVLRPDRSGLRSNIFVTTNQRAYEFLLISDNGAVPLHYVLRYPQPRLAAVPITTPSPTPVTDLSDIPCIDSNYSVDDSPDHRAHGPVPPSRFVPTKTCNDGEHTYIQLQRFTELPNDLPVLSDVDRQHPGGVITNYVYDSAHFRYVVDGVPDALQLLYGSPKDRILVRIRHNVGDLR